MFILIKAQKNNNIKIIQNAVKEINKTKSLLKD
jgi:hypothetical protein